MRNRNKGKIERTREATVKDDVFCSLNCPYILFAKRRFLTFQVQCARFTPYGGLDKDKTSFNVRRCYRCIEEVEHPIFEEGDTKKDEKMNPKNKRNNEETQ